MNYESMRELIATALYDFDNKGLCDDEFQFMIPVDWKGHADAILAALDAAGALIAPKLPTHEMLDSFSDAIHNWLDEQGEDEDVYLAMLAASPFAKP